MSGQWKSLNKSTKSASCFPRILQDTSYRNNLRERINQLLPDEVVIVATYVDGLIKTRPIKMRSIEGWETTINGPGWVEKEDRSHMAVLELESDPK